MIVFTSAKAVRNFLKTLAAVVGETAVRNYLHDAVVAAIGKITSAALESEEKSAEIIPVKHTVTDLLAAIADYFFQKQWTFQKNIKHLTKPD